MGSGGGARLRRKHSSCLTGGSEKLLWKVKDRQHPHPIPPQKRLFPVFVIMASSWHDCGEMQVAKLGWFLAVPVAMYRECVDKATAGEAPWLKALLYPKDHHAGDP